MRNIVMTTTMAFIGGLFSAGLVLADAAETGASLSSQAEMAKQQQVGALKLEGKKINEMQKALNEKGYAVGPVDGIVGPKTSNAIREFQSQQGLTATGQPDQQTLKALGIEVGEQEFMGVSPEFGDERQPYQPDEMPMQPMERTDQMPMQQMEEQPRSSGSTETR